MRLAKRCNSYLPERNDFFNQVLGKDFFMEPQHFFGQNMQIKVNIKENESEYAIEVAAPGYEKEEFKLELDNHVLSIEVSRETNNDNTNENYTHFEFDNGSFKRAFSLPKGKANEAEIAAKYNNGILNIVIPKTEEAKPKPKRLLNIA
ncbi:Hsp20/alpha crystallin family protein [Carboxylicivirga sp. N1Y90]|uniref:Hsp20/alpha crystallin family protein n=1 Tax=Carboxylicivirga fragile TaxID=3417571 RepID=UPI003D327B0B|nr:Hsp20/alpha crystallin family protein [Marinilabiliaceae bacterium N1Y90]